MSFQNLKLFLLFYLILLALVLILSIRFRNKYWSLFGSVLFPLILIVLITYNLVMFPAFNRIDVPPYFQARLQQLSSKDLIDLFDKSITKARSAWIYTLVEIYYQGRVLLIPIDQLDSLGLSMERLQDQGRLMDIRMIDTDFSLTEGEVELILSLDHADLSTKEGDYFHFVTQVKDPAASLLLIKYENQLFFIPEDLLPVIKEDL